MIKWNDNEPVLWLLTVEEFEQLPEGVKLTSIGGSEVTKGIDNIDLDTRFGYLAFGIIGPLHHSESELFTKFMLNQ